MTAYTFFKWGAKIAPLLPVWLGNGLSDLAGFIFYLVAPAKRRVVMSNLARALADQPLSKRHKVARGIFRNAVRNYYDLLRVHKISVERLGELVEVNGLNECKRLAEREGYNGFIAISAHIGSFSLSAQVASPNEIDFHLLLEPIQPPELFELVRGLRQVDPRSHMISVASMELRQVFKALRQPNNYLATAIDRDVTGGGKPLRFFGETACLPTGTAQFALHTGAPVVPLHVYRRPNGEYVIDFYPDRIFIARPTEDKKNDVKRVAEQMLSEIEKLIRLTPEQWVVLQPIWPEK